MTQDLPTKRRGFTLVEILLSLGLLMLVLATAYSALNLFRIVTTAGRADAERSQLARAIERRMTADIRCILYREEEPEPAATGESPPAGQVQMGTGGAADDPQEVSTDTSTATDLAAEETVVPITDPAEAYATQSVGVFGDATTLVMHVSRPPRPALVTTEVPDPLVAAQTPLTTSDLRSVSYFLAVAGSGGLEGAVGNVASGGTANFSVKSGAQGLARLDGDRLALQQAYEAGQVDVMAQSSELLAPEVTELTFRYFDGATWLDTWDSSSMKAVPRAIEVTLRIDVTADDDNKPALRYGESPTLSSDDLFRFVIAVPLSDPTLGLEL